MADWSVRNANAGPQRNADALLRAGGGFAVQFLIAPAVGDATDAGQVGLDPPQYQELPLGPAVFRKARPQMQEGNPARYELLLSASAVAQQVSELQLNSADALFGMAAMVQVAGLTLVVEEWAATAMLGAPVVYRMLLRAAEPVSLNRQS